MPGAGTQDPWSLCLEAIAAAERGSIIPRHLLRAIAIAESGRRHPERDAYVPWPWTINAQGEGRFLPTKEAAVATVRFLQAENVSNIDVGCMQVNLRHHPQAFDSMEKAFDPEINVAYAARFLSSLFRDSGSWGNAVARYHASVYRMNLQYRNRVLRIWHRLRQ